MALCMYVCLSLFSFPLLLFFFIWGGRGGGVGGEERMEDGGGCLFEYSISFIFLFFLFKI